MTKIATHKTIILAALVILSATQANAANNLMVLRGNTPPPIGYIQFCKDHPDDCHGYDKPSQVVRLTDVAWRGLNAVNTGVNTAILPATDMQIYGVLEHWDYPKVAGDCEDYVLEKRRQLIEQGWPESALLITVVRDEAGDGHAVLTVRTDRGDVVLDNKTDKIEVWSDTPYSYVKRQSSRDPNAWDLIQDDRTTLVGSLR